MACRNIVSLRRAYRLQSQTGGGLSKILDSLGRSGSANVWPCGRKGAALSAETKDELDRVGGLPPLAAVGLWIMNSAYIAMLFVDPLGQKILAGAILTLGFGIAAMRFLIHKSL